MINVKNCNLVINKMKRNLKKYHVGEIVLIMMLSTKTVYASEVISEFPELSRILDLLIFFIELIRAAASVIGGLIATAAGWNILTNTNGNGMEVAKKTFKNAVTGVVVIFSGASFATFMIERIGSILLG